MPVQPRKKQENIAFYEQRAPIWTANAVALNVSAERTAELEALATAARTAFNNAAAKRAQAKAATAALNEAMAAMNALGSELIKGIRITAEVEGDPSLYGLAQIPEPKDPAPIPPVEASNVEYELLTNATIALTWDGSVSTGTVYVVRRAIKMPGQEQTNYTTLGVADEKSYQDDTVPLGAQSASYIICAKKGGEITPGTAPVTVRLTKGANGQAAVDAA
ncbi:MAG: hypothetical protein ACIAS6_01920 [Phycisphaerales bacterium JB060]